jgi:hypothetical protein
MAHQTRPAHPAMRPVQTPTGMPVLPLGLLGGFSCRVLACPVSH